MFKTRVSENTIMDAEIAFQKHGRIVRCMYGDNVFMDCIPSNNRSQVIHQATILHFKIGIFVTSKVEDEKGSLVQIVIIEFSDEDLNKHRQSLIYVSELIIGWMYHSNILKRGYLVDKDIPDFVLHN